MTMHHFSILLFTSKLALVASLLKKSSHFGIRCIYIGIVSLKISYWHVVLVVVVAPKPKLLSRGKEIRYGIESPVFGFMAVVSYQGQFVECFSVW